MYNKTDHAKRPAAVVWTDRRGVAAAEFALVASILVTILFAMVDIGYAVKQQLVLQQALRAGGEYAEHFPTQCTGILASVQSALPSSANWTGALQGATLCLDGAAVSSCGSSPPSCTPIGGRSIALNATVPWSLFKLHMNTPFNAASYAISIQ